MDLATVVKPHGLDGSVRVSLDTDFPERLPEWRDLEMVGPGGVQRARVQGVKGITGGRCIIKLEGVSDREQAEALRGNVLRIKLSDIPPLPDGCYYDFQIIGLQAVTTEGRDLGKVKAILRTGANDIYETDAGLIPAIESVVQEIDLENGRIVIQEVEGLFD